MIIVERMPGPAMARRQVEIVERKGLGHPDTLCDALMEEVSLALNGAYLEQCGRVLHNNIDKGLLIAGQVEKRFGGGRVLKPMELIIGDRATMEYAGRPLPVADIATAAARDWINRHLPHVDAQRDVLIRVALAPAAAELTGLFEHPGVPRPANDTSAAVGYWPLTPTETAVLELEGWLNGASFKQRFPETAQDVKVMAVREGQALDLTVAMPLLCAQVVSEADYFERKEAVRREILAWTRDNLPLETQVRLNTLDQPGQGVGGVYLSLLGTSAEDSDSGQVGRGNRVNGLIPVNRPIGTEAVCGKNPLSHTGKIYNVLAHRAARAIGEQVEEVEEVEVSLVSRIGQSLDRPLLAAVRLLSAEGCDFAPLIPRAREILAHELAATDDLCRRLCLGEEPLGVPQ
ncbi:methionine adenosyltransferase [Geoalkalibacter halelectricus]|uniref:Methionine adenosyltransferase n=1 Tax=Geoalkalibacter halelectricus TaxID=2847045 RepID=A0ABY5ZI94_9BACT|nr:methionine adenosyltransferase [Geoalkalibacter halelectricus]UWZ78431.1 methionine adenosyltransferase [Geoalkalibacter halelectricus]